MNNGKICIAICARNADELVNSATSSAAIADLVEFRLDCLDEIPENFGNLGINSNSIVTLRPSEQGGNRNIDLSERQNFWRNFQIKCGADLEADVIECTSGTLSPKICSFHDFSGTMRDIGAIYEQLSKTPADIIKIAIAVRDSSDSLDVWQLLNRAGSDNKGSIPIAMGEAGKWTRILGLAHGAYLTYAALESGTETAPGQITAHDLTEVFRVKELGKQTDVYGIVAGDTTYSMSPYIHNAAFKSERMNAVFVPFQVTDLDAFITRMVRPETREVELNFRGFSVTNPHKQAVIKYLDHVDEAAAKIGAVNTIKIIDGKLHGFNTDARGFVAPLREKFNVKDSRAAIIGAGGAARSCIYALKSSGADVTVFARDKSKVAALADDFDINVGILENGGSGSVADFSTFDLIVNATPVGTLGEKVKDTVATADQLRNVKFVYDLVYNPGETRLIKEAKIAGAKTQGGFDMLIAQAAEQFKIWTGKVVPIDVMSTAAKKRLYDG